MPASRLGYLFDKYTRNECSLEERYEFLELLQKSEHDEELRTLLKELAANTAPDAVLPHVTGDAMLKSILGKDFVEQQELPEHQLPGKLRSLRQPKTRKWLSVAAACAVLLGVIGFMLKYTGAKNIPVNTTSSSTGDIIVTTHTGERKAVELPDGTRIWLSPSSSLKYPPVFATGTRVVSLSGEAFFEVAHNPEKPFIIHSGMLHTKVLGTSFNIQAYESQENIAVTVVTGKVKVSNDKEVQNVELLPNQRVVFNKRTDKLLKESTDTTQAPDILKRKEGTFVYRSEPLQKLAADIETYFGVNIKVAEAIKQCRVVASFEITDRPQAILELIAISINGTLQAQNNQFILSGEACPD